MYSGGLRKSFTFPLLQYVRSGCEHMFVKCPTLKLGSVTQAVVTLTAAYGFKQWLVLLFFLFQ